MYCLKQNESATAEIQVVVHVSKVSRPISNTFALCVSQPMAIRFTPVFATDTTVSGVMPPDASLIALPSMRRTASLKVQ